MSLGTKTAILLATMVFSLLAAVSAFSLHYQERSLRAAILKGVDGEAQMAARGIASFIEESLGEAAAVSLALSANGPIEGRLDDAEGQLAEVSRIFPKFQNGIFVLDRSGRFLADYPPHHEMRGHSFAFRDYYQRTIAEDRGVVGVPYESKRTARPVLTFTAPVRDHSGKTVAIVACSVDLLSQEALGGYREQKFGETGYLIVFDRSHRLILHPQDERILTTVETGKNRVLDAAVAGYEGAEATVNSRDVPMLLAVRHIPGTDWVVGVQVPQSEAFRPILEARRHIAAAFALSLFVVVLAGLVAIRRVARPLQQLERVVFQIGSELEGKKVPRSGAAQVALASLARIGARDEIGRLAASFQRLTALLEQTLGSLQRSAEEWKRTIDAVSEAVLTLDVEGRIERMNRAAERWFGVTEEAARGEPVEGVLQDSVPPLGWPLAFQGRQSSLEWCQALERPRGIFDFTFTPIAAGGQIIGGVVIVKEVTDRKRLEEQLRQAHKMEAVGRLASGVAHDFNNILTVILSSARFVREKLPGDHPLREELGVILDAAARATSLTRQLMEFSRRQAIDPEVVDLAARLQAGRMMMQHLVGDRVDLRVADSSPCWVKVSASQIDQLIINLTVNANDAMPEGGRLSFELIPIDSGDAAGRADGLPAGPCVRLSVSDTGIGMEEGVLARIFEPFFTTKEVGKGVGLGLATVYGIVEQSGGAVRVTSSPGKGSTFNVYLPRVNAPNGADA